MKNNLTTNNNAAVGMQGLAGHIAAIWTGQEHEASGHLTWLSWTTHRDTAELLHSLLGHGGWDQRSPDWFAHVSDAAFSQLQTERDALTGTRTDSIDSNTIAYLLV